jgi:hypothetical protein
LFATPLCPVLFVGIAIVRVLPHPPTAYLENEAIGVHDAEVGLVGRGVLAMLGCCHAMRCYCRGRRPEEVGGQCPGPEVGGLG